MSDTSGKAGPSSSPDTANTKTATAASSSSSADPPASTTTTTTTASSVGAGVPSNRLAALFERPGPPPSTGAERLAASAAVVKAFQQSRYGGATKDGDAREKK